ncbi:MAG: hypothetical protein GWN01_03140 [Nitrosopumilaceae archaeon]|nr:hypothetical protein [Nitrosopumilaceae archaeon]NIT99960.1 hypothetical protein [Nitrosopumilaceae archaeon]NIU86315.1 hypothetical protein [Nitrosopumilaceae archaeon]NIV65070.1 hypothetical protein [Nitrosopumilaceae archaeon]NIX60563.1 hypothetical protein [Nitrosopumilaceae archaeon]
MRTTPIECTCTNCDCGIYTYNEDKICIACTEGKHNSGAIRLSARKYKEESKETSQESLGTKN